MTLNSWNTLAMTLAFVVPGFIFYGVMASFIPLKEDKTEVLFLKSLVVSAVNWILWLPLVLLTALWLTAGGSLLVLLPVGLLVVLASPLLLGVVAAFVRQRGWDRTLAVAVGLQPVHPTPTSWDYYFHHSGPVIILVTLKNGQQVTGLYGPHSFASSRSAGRDIYLERIATHDAQGRLMWIPGSQGALIEGENILSLEFFR